MSRTFSIMQVHPDQVLESEQMGSKEKFWFRDPEDPAERDWLFKFPTPGTGQHWAEKIAYEIACEMRIVAPRVELAEFEGKRGSATLSFTKVRSGRTFERYELFHGNQILAGMDAAYDPDRAGRHPMHTVQRIFRSMDIFQSREYAESCRVKLAEYLVFDALIGNVDRHHENWGILRKQLKDCGYRGRLAPSFDHASSLGRELVDEGGKQSRKRYLDDLGVEKYSERASGAVFVDETSKRGPSPLKLVKWCLAHNDFSRYFRPSLKKLDSINPSAMKRATERIPDSWMGDLPRGFVIDLFRVNLETLKDYEL